MFYFAGSGAIILSIALCVEFSAVTYSIFRPTAARMSILQFVVYF